MSDFPKQKVTIYHKNEQNKYERYVKEASIRNTSLLNKDRYGLNSSDNVIIRIFDTKGYNKNIHMKNTTAILNCPLSSFLGETWKIQQGDIIVNGFVKEEIEGNTPQTLLNKKYGKENVFKVNSINILIFFDDDIEETNHVKLGCI